MNRLSGLFIQVYIRQMPAYNHNGRTAEHMGQTTRADSALICALPALSEDLHYRTQCDFAYLFHIFIVPHISPFIYHCQALFRSNTSVWCCQMSVPMIFYRNTILIMLTFLYKRLSCEFWFSDFVYLLLDRITFP